MEKKINKAALSIASHKNNKGKMIYEVMASQGGMLHVTDAYHALSWRPSDQLTDGAYKIDAIGTPLIEVNFPSIGRVNPRLRGETQRSIPRPNIEGISIKRAIIGIPLIEGLPVTIQRLVTLIMQENYIYINSEYMPPKFMYNGSWEVHKKGNPAKQPLIVTLEDEKGIVVSYVVMPMSK